MNTLGRITTDYQEDEDRFRLVGEYENGQVVVLWLSQRLLVRLLPHLFKWLESQSASPIPQDLVQSLEFEAARAEHCDAEPVLSSAESLRGLVLAVDITPGPDLVTIHFRADTNISGQVNLNAEQLRQWLGILHALWNAADWPNAVWPDWISPSEQSEVIPKQLYH